MDKLLCWVNSLLLSVATPCTIWVWSLAHQEVTSISSTLESELTLWCDLGVEWNGSDGMPIVSFQTLSTFSFSAAPRILSLPCVNKPGEASWRMREHVEGSLIIPTGAILKQLTSNWPPICGAAQPRSIELSTQQSIADCRHTINTDQNHPANSQSHKQ